MSDLGNKKIFAKNLQHYMDLNNKDRNKICSDLDFKYTTVTDWINAKKYPRIDKIEILANYFGIEKSDLIEDKKKQTKNHVFDIFNDDRFKVKAELLEGEEITLEQWQEAMDRFYEIKNKIKNNKKQ